MSLTETKAKHAEQIAAILKEIRPDLTPGQVAEIQRQAAATIRDWDIAPLSRELNEMTVRGLIGTIPSLTRAAPSAAQLQAYLEKQHCEKFEIERAPGDVRLQIARDVAAMSADERIAALPFAEQKKLTVAPLSEVEKIEARAASADSDEDADAWIKKTFGVDAATLLPSKRRDYLSHRQASTEAQRRDAGKVDELNLKSGGDTSKLSAQDRMTLFRTEQALQKRA